MIAFTSVLYPTDLSEASRPALHYARSIASWYDAKLRVVHVVSSLTAAGAEDVSLGFAAPGSAHTELVKPVERVRRAVGEFLQDVGYEISVEVGDASKVIVAEATATSSDLIVMGTHGRSGFDRLVRGSVAEKVSAHAPCPVMTVPPLASVSSTPEPLFRHILCPVDFSPASDRALAYALDLARQADGRLTVMHSVEWFSEGDPGVDRSFDLKGLRASLTAQAQQRLSNLIGRESPTWVDIRGIVRSGRPYREVLAHASSFGVDLIVIGAQGATGLDLALHGSTTQQVLRLASCPVLVVRSLGAPAVASS